jgi:hypothetical protein
MFVSPIAAQLITQHRAGLQAEHQASLLERIPPFGQYAAEDMERITKPSSCDSARWR